MYHRQGMGRLKLYEKAGRLLFMVDVLLFRNDIGKRQWAITCSFEDVCLHRPRKMTDKPPSPILPSADALKRSILEGISE